MINKYMINCKKCGEQSGVPEKYTPCPVCFLKQNDDTTLGDHYDAENDEYVDHIVRNNDLTVDQQIRIAALNAAIAWFRVYILTGNSLDVNLLDTADVYVNYIKIGEHQ